MRNNNNNGGGCAPMLTAIIFAFVAGSLLVVALTRGEAFKPQPSQAVISAAYRDKARVETKAIEDQLAANLAYDKNIKRINEQFLQTGKDLLVIAGGIGLIGCLVWVGSFSLQTARAVRYNARLIKPNNRGLFPIYMSPEGLAVNPNLQTTAIMDLSNPQSLSPELQIEAYAWHQRAAIAGHLSQTKTFAATANLERGILRNAALPPGQAQQSHGPQPITIGAPLEFTDNDTRIITHADEDDEPAHGPATPGHTQTHGGTNTHEHEPILTESEYYANLLKSRQRPGQ